MALVVVTALLWGFTWLVYRFRKQLVAKLPSQEHALVLLFFSAMALFAALVALADYGAAQGRANLPVVRTLNELRAVPDGAEAAVVGRVSPDLPLAYYDKFVVYTDHSNPATDALLSGTPALRIALLDGETSISNTSYRTADWHADGVDSFVYGLMRDDPVVVHAARAGDGLVARRVLRGEHRDFVAYERWSVVLNPYLAAGFAANALVWCALAVAGYLAVRRRGR